MNDILRKLLDEIELPEEAYETSVRRYEDLGVWLGRDGARCAQFEPHIGPQGSFLLGTASRPPSNDVPYDLDLFCSLTQGLSKATITQAEVKKLLGRDLHDYRMARQIVSPLSEKKRCWRIDYADRMSFHLDITPGIPADDLRRENVRKVLLNEYSNEGLAQQVADRAIDITDNTLPNFDTPSLDWPLSNPEGYGVWFQFRMKLAESYLHKRSVALHANVNDVPVFRWKTPLQEALLLLKRHRDIMFKDDINVQPISIIITTLAAQAYRGENTVEGTLITVLETMSRYISSESPRVPNPVNLEEDFADKWSDSKYSDLQLELNFNGWLAQAQRDFNVLLSASDEKRTVEVARRAFGVTLKSSSIVAPGIISKPQRIDSSAKPWLKE